MNRQHKTIWTLLSIIGLCALSAYMVPMVTATAAEPEPAAENPAKVDDASPVVTDDAAAAEPAGESHSVGQQAVDAPPAEPNLDAEAELTHEEPQALADPPAQADEGAQIDGASTGAPEIPSRGDASAAPAPEQQGHQTGDLGSESRGDGGGPRAPFDPATLKLSFQAYLTDNAGDALPGPTIDLEFNIYTGGGGLVEGPIAMAAVDITDGMVDVLVPVSAGSFDGSERLMGVTVNPPAAELAPRIPLVSVPYALRVDRVASAELDDNIDLGDAATSGSLTVYSSSYGGPGIFLDGVFGTISTYGTDGLEQTRLWNGSWGELLLWDGSVTNDQTVSLSATNDSGGQLSLRDATGGDAVFLDGGTGTVNADGEVNIVDGIGGTKVAKLSQLSLGVRGGRLETFNDTGTFSAIFGTSTVAGGVAELRQADGGLGAVLDGDETGADGGGALRLYDAAGTQTVDILGSTGIVSATGDIGTYSTLAGTLLGHIDKHGGGSWFKSFDTTGTQTGVFGSSATGDGGFAQLYNNSNVLTVRIDGDDGDAGLIQVRNSAGATTITLDGEIGGDGRVTTQELVITGGSDLSEQFDVGEARGTGPAPGRVVSIDPSRPGKLIVSAKAYDRTVAGILSGAGGLEPGMMMGQEGSLANGAYPVALTGRVYCWCDATRGAIQPGDLLTTSATPGHAMKVRDHAKAQGAILGKAMTSLDEGRGLVLVLVSLQ